MRQKSRQKSRDTELLQSNGESQFQKRLLRILFLTLKSHTRNLRIEIENCVLHLGNFSWLVKDFNFFIAITFLVDMTLPVLSCVV